MTSLSDENLILRHKLEKLEPSVIATDDQEPISKKELAAKLKISRQAIDGREASGTLQRLGWQPVPGTGTHKNNPKLYRSIPPCN